MHDGNVTLRDPNKSFKNVVNFKHNTLRKTKESLMHDDMRNLFNHVSACYSAVQPS
jgi:hypothetical protein